MKRLVLLLICFLLFVSIINAEDEVNKKDSWFAALQFTLIVSNHVDFALTKYALDNNLASEANPLYLDSPGLSIAILEIGNLGILFLSDKLFEKHETAAWITMTALTLIKLFFIYHNVKVISN